MAAKNDLTGFKMLVASGALAGILGGWVLISMAGGQSGNGATAQDPAILDWVNKPLPTLAKPNGAVGAAGVIPQAGPAVPTAAAPTLRSVNQQPANPSGPAPVTNTQSSR
jgi:hypothetical protein